VEQVYTQQQAKQFAQFALSTTIAATLQHLKIKLSYVQMDTSVLKG